MLQTTKAAKRSTGSKLKATIKGSTHKKELALIDQYLASKGQKVPHEYAMKALYEFITEGETLYFTDTWIDFVRELRAVLLIPEVLELFLARDAFTEKGLYDSLKRLEVFFTTLKPKEVRADLYKVGLTEYPERYGEADEWDGLGDIRKDFTPNQN